MKVLVTGNQGFVGSAFTDLIRQERAGYHIAGLDTGFFAPRDNFDGATVAEPSFRQLVADIRDAGHSIFSGVDAVVHLAAISNDPMGDLDESVTFDVNVTGTVRLASLPKKPE